MTIREPQASRAGLIATIVVSLIINGLLAVMLFKQSSENGKLQAQVADVTRRYADVVTEPALVTPEYGDLKEKARAGNVSVYDLLTSQRNDLAAAIAGEPIGAPEARQRADQANRQANEALQGFASRAGVSVTPGNNLLETLGRWPAVVSKLVEQREQARRETAAGVDRMKLAESAHQLSLAEKDKAIADARAEVSRLNDRLGAAQQAYSRAMADLQAGAAVSNKNQTQQILADEAAIAQKEQEIDDLQRQITGFKIAHRALKANTATKDNGMRVPDGQITTVAGNVCFINLGRGDQIGAGMTFEVYDPNKGIPPLGDGTSVPDRPSRRGGQASLPAAASRVLDSYAFTLPRGKGSIEVINVGPGHTAECRIIHKEPGENISQGDLIANLVYDRNIKYNFIVWGDFDLHNGRTGNRANDINVIQRLVEEWGARLQPIADPSKPADAVTPDTDFVVVGREPQVPDYTELEMKEHPELRYEWDRAHARLLGYQAVLSRAADFGVPVLNQDRFLYYTGYYDRATR